MACEGNIRITSETCAGISVVPKRGAAVHDNVRSQLKIYLYSFTKQLLNQDRLNTGLRDAPESLRPVHMIVRTVNIRVLVLIRTMVSTVIDCLTFLEKSAFGSVQYTALSRSATVSSRSAAEFQNICRRAGWTKVSNAKSTPGYVNA